MEVADYGERGWTWWEVLELSGLEDKLYEEKAKNAEERVGQGGEDLHAFLGATGLGLSLVDDHHFL